MMSATTTEDDPLLTMEGIAEHTGRSLSTVRKWSCYGRLPEPDVTYGPRRLFWRTSTIDAMAVPPRRWPQRRAS